MPEKEKVMTVALMRSDLYDAPSYTGAFLKLPASRDKACITSCKYYRRYNFIDHLEAVFQFLRYGLFYLKKEESKMDSNRFFAEIIRRVASRGITAGEINDGCLPLVFGSSGLKKIKEQIEKVVSSAEAVLEAEQQAELTQRLDMKMGGM